MNRSTRGHNRVLILLLRGLNHLLRAGQSATKFLKNITVHFVLISSSYLEGCISRFVSVLAELFKGGWIWRWSAEKMRQPAFLPLRRQQHRKINTTHHFFDPDPDSE